MTAYNVLEECLREGFIDYKINADKRYVPKILTNNRKKRLKVLDTVLSQLYSCDTFLFSVAFVTKSGLACIKDALIHNGQVKGKILASQYLNFTEPSALRELLKFPNLEVRMITEEKAFHAKGYIFHHRNNSEESYSMIIGSSNMTANALTHNQEWNIFVTSAENGALIRQTIQEFSALWDAAEVVNDAWINAYEAVYSHTHVQTSSVAYIPFRRIYPNKMQQAALAGIQALRDRGEDRGLLISATGTGKTYLSAFDMYRFNPRRSLFIVHREIIVQSARDSYIKVGFSPSDTGLLTGRFKDEEKKYIFATVQTLSQDKVLYSFAPDAFEYIVIDEVHHGGADTYQKIVKYFKPKFWLGMTATPERSDDFDIYDMFHHNIAYEIRLHQALEENMLVPFHYHGISEISVDGKLLDDKSDFNLLTSEERVRHILYYADLYGSDMERVKGLVFCSSVEEAYALAAAFQKHGKRAAALSGKSSERERQQAVARLESQSGKNPDYIEYIFTCDIFNEGVDIPQVNQIIMLRPTQSAIVFVQQLGRGLRKYPGKRYLEVLDFIGNYENNFLLPIALYGDRTYDKDFVRQLMHVNYLPGATSVFFDDVVKERIYEAIDSRHYLADLRELKCAYRNMEYRLGRQPMMMDFVHFGDIDPYLFIAKKDSFYGFVQYIQPYESTMNNAHCAVLTMLSQEVANGKRAEELFLLDMLLDTNTVSADILKSAVQETYQYSVSENTLAGVANILSLQFFVTAAQKKYGNYPLVFFDERVRTYTRTPYFAQLLENQEFRTYVKDILQYGFYRFHKLYTGKEAMAVQGFVRYEKYSRKDVSRILNYSKNREGTLNGYAIIGHTCPIFVTYNKREDISANTKYEDRFVSPQQFSWMTRARVRLDSDQVAKIMDIQTRKLLFVKKSDAEGKDFYYLGDLSVMNEPTETTIKNDQGQELPIVNFQFLLDEPVESKLYGYLNS